MKKNDLTNNGSKRKPSLLTRLLWWCAGVDSELIKKCPHEWAKYASMGATILFTGIFASIAGGYALYTVFRNGSLSSIDNNAIMYAMIFGLFWGLVIFNLDRYIITTFKKSDSKSGIINICKDTFHALPRILLAIIIAITISKPIELKLFENRISKINIETTAPIAEGNLVINETKAMKSASVDRETLNAILNSTKELKGCRLYVSLFPCHECAKAIIQSGIKEIVYEDDKYNGTDSDIASKRMLDAAGVKYRKMEKVSVEVK